jgi:hypothetical protein
MPSVEVVPSQNCTNAVEVRDRAFRVRITRGLEPTMETSGFPSTAPVTETDLTAKSHANRKLHRVTWTT